MKIFLAWRPAGRAFGADFSGRPRPTSLKMRFGPDLGSVLDPFGAHSGVIIGRIRGPFWGALPTSESSGVSSYSLLASLSLSLGLAHRSHKSLSLSTSPSLLSLLPASL